MKEIEFVTVPSGTFLWGYDCRNEGELDYMYRQGAVFQESEEDIYEYRISKNLITAPMVSEFLSNTRYDMYGKLYCGFWGAIHTIDIPAIMISRWDAEEFCKWYSSQVGKTVRLPTEMEWEKAACWDEARRHARVYPWGDEWNAAHCNTRESGPGTITPVGLYPQGASPYGCLDMSGNVWEWVGGIYPHNYYSCASDGTIRGGCFASNKYQVKCKSRHCDIWELPSRSIGFRVVMLD